MADSDPTAAGSATPGAPERALCVLHRIEDAFLASLLLAMIVLAPTQILLRVAFDSAITWGDPALRALVLWVGLMGAVAASRGNRHITIDVLSHVLPERGQAAVRAGTSLFTVFICGLVAWHGYRFVRDEFEYESVAFAGLPSWAVESVIPFAFGVMAIRFALLAAAALRDLIRGGAATGS